MTATILQFPARQIERPSFVDWMAAKVGPKWSVVKHPRADGLGVSSRGASARGRPPTGPGAAFREMTKIKACSQDSCSGCRKAMPDGPDEKVWIAGVVILAYCAACWACLNGKAA